MSYGKGESRAKVGWNNPIKAIFVRGAYAVLSDINLLRFHSNLFRVGVIFGTS